MEKLTKNKKLIAFAALLLLAGAFGAWYFLGNRSSNTSSYIFVPVKKGDLTAEIKAQGTVKPAEEINLSFELGGRVNKINFKVGDKVKTGQVIAELDKSDLSANLAQSSASVQIAQSQLTQLQAALEMQKINLSQLMNGARPEDLQISSTQKANADKSLLDAQANLDNVRTKTTVDLNNQLDKITDLLPDAYAKAFDAVNRQTDELFNNGSGQSPELIFSTPLDSQAKVQAESGRLLANLAVAALNDLPASLKPDRSNYYQVSTEASSQLNTIKNFLNATNQALSAAVISTDLPQATLNGYRSNLNTASTNINTAISGLSSYRQAVDSITAANQNSIKTAETAVNNANSAALIASQQLILKEAGATKDQIAAQASLVKQAQANVQTQLAQINSAKAAASKTRSQLDKATIKSPIDGQLTKLDLKIGEEVAPLTPQASIISDSKLQIEILVPEAAVAAIKVGDQSDVTLDSFGNEVFSAKVISVDPAANIGNDGVATYKVKLEFINLDNRIRSGFTANVKIYSGSEKNVIIVSQTSVLRDGYDNYVIVDNGSPAGEKRKIQLGAVIQNGQVGVISGLTENDKVADFINKAN